MSRPITITIALLVLTAIVVLYNSVVEQRGQAAMAPPAVPGTARPTIETSAYSSTNAESQAAYDSPLGYSGGYTPTGDKVVTQQQTDAPVLSGEYSSDVPRTERGLDPAAVVADMSGGGPIAAEGPPPSDGPSLIDRGLSGPNRSGPALGAGIAEPEISQPDASTETPISLGPGPSQTDLGLPGPGEGEE